MTFGYIVLCDFAEQDPSGKIHMVGGGWSHASTEPHPHGVVVFFKMPAERFRQLTDPLSVRLVLTNDQAHIVEGPGITGPQRMDVSGQIERVGASLPSGVELPREVDLAFALNVSALTLAPGNYQWTAEVEGKEIASTQFNVSHGSLQRVNPPIGG